MHLAKNILEQRLKNVRNEVTLSEEKVVCTRNLSDTASKLRDEDGIRLQFPIKGHQYKAPRTVIVNIRSETVVLPNGGSVCMSIENAMRTFMVYEGNSRS